ncbi:hypothetical protein [Arthrobacter sp. SX1312]|uniref:hypothetical protein n=1 Tax=Arthrobacter sp. SX1312 TaxID=2058896 RepID=UPI0011B0D1A1|nr:hypothetical protein [Arthrobacter sp. SX1312]
MSVTVHVSFWTTLVFAVLERASVTDTGVEWSPDRLPALPDHSRRSRLPEFIASLVFLAALAVAVLWQQVSSVVRAADGSAVPLLDPALWSFWLPWFLGLIAAEAVFAAWLYLRDWSWAAAVVNLVLALAFAVPAVLLWSGGGCSIPTSSTPSGGIRPPRPAAAGPSPPSSPGWWSCSSPGMWWTGF